MGCWNNWICIYFNKGPFVFCTCGLNVCHMKEGRWRYASFVYIWYQRWGRMTILSNNMTNPRYLAMFCLNNTRMHLNNLFNINISFLYIYRSSLRCYISLLVIIIYIMNWCIESFILYKRKGSSTILKLILISNPSW